MSDIFGFGIKLITMMGSICKVGVSTLLQIAGALSVFQKNGGGEEERLGDHFPLIGNHPPEN